MKYQRTAISAALALSLLAACSKPSATDNYEDIADTKGEWTHEQTNKAIDIYLEGLKEEEGLLDRNIELRRRLEFFDENRCSRSVLKERRAEIDSARARLDAKRAGIRAISR